MLVGTCSGVTFAGIVISSAFEGTSSGNSSLTNDRISDVFPTPWSPTSSIRTFRRVGFQVTMVSARPHDAGHRKRNVSETKVAKFPRSLPYPLDMDKTYTTLSLHTKHFSHTTRHTLHLGTDNNLISAFFSQQSHKRFFPEDRGTLDNASSIQAPRQLAKVAIKIHCGGCLQSSQETCIWHLGQRHFCSLTIRFGIRI